ncbi:hypothetical protein AHAS_Ahas07G0139500 [Arachis hypogaea]
MSYIKLSWVRRHIRDKQPLAFGSLFRDMLGVTSFIYWVLPSSLISQRPMSMRSIYNCFTILSRFTVIVGGSNFHTPL